MWNEVAKIPAPRLLLSGPARQQPQRISASTFLPSLVDASLRTVFHNRIYRGSAREKP